MIANFRRLFLILVMLWALPAHGQGIRPSPPPPTASYPLYFQGNNVSCQSSQVWTYDQSYLNNSYGAQCVAGEENSIQKFNGSKEIENDFALVGGPSFLGVANKDGTTGSVAELRMRVSPRLATSQSATIKTTNVNGGSQLLQSAFFFDGTYDLPVSSQAPQDSWNHDGVFTWYQCNIVQVDTTGAGGTGTGCIIEAGNAATSGYKVCWDHAVVTFTMWDVGTGDTHSISVNTAATLWPGNWLVCYGRYSFSLDPGGGVIHGYSAPIMSMKVNELPYVAEEVTCNTPPSPLGLCLSANDQGTLTRFATQGFYGGLFEMAMWEDVYYYNQVGGQARFDLIWEDVSHSTETAPYNAIIPTTGQSKQAECLPTNRDGWSGYCDGSDTRCWSCQIWNKPYPNSGGQGTGMFGTSTDAVPWSAASASGYYPSWNAPDDRSEVDFYVFDGLASQKMLTLKAQRDVGAGATKEIVLGPGVVLATDPGTRASFSFADHTGTVCNPMNTVIEAVTPGAAGNSITITLVSDSYDTYVPYVTVAGNAVTLHYAMYYGGNYAADMEDAITALTGVDKIIQVKTIDTNQNLLDCEFGPLNMAGGVDAPVAPIPATGAMTWLDINGTGRQPSLDVKAGTLKAPETLTTKGSWVEGGLQSYPGSGGGPIRPILDLAAATGYTDLNTVLEAVPVGTPGTLVKVSFYDGYGSPRIETSILSSREIAYEIYYDSWTPGTYAGMEAMINAYAGANAVIRVKTPSTNPTFTFDSGEYANQQPLTIPTAVASKLPPLSTITSSYSWRVPCSGSGVGPGAVTIPAYGCVMWAINAGYTGYPFYADLVDKYSTMTCNQYGALYTSPGGADLKLTMSCGVNTTYTSTKPGYYIKWCNVGGTSYTTNMSWIDLDTCSIGVRVFNASNIGTLF